MYNFEIRWILNSDVLKEGSEIGQTWTCTGVGVKIHKI